MYKNVTCDTANGWVNRQNCVTIKNQLNTKKSSNRGKRGQKCDIQKTNKMAKVLCNQ